MGWLTESAFQPKESKKINLDSHSSLVSLKVKLLEEKARLTSSLKLPQKPLVTKVNPDVEKRAARDLQDLPIQKLTASDQLREV